FEIDSHQWHEDGLLLVADGRIAPLAPMRNYIPAWQRIPLWSAVDLCHGTPHSDKCYRAIKTGSALHADTVLNTI
ncbi:MAG: hypothetical protein ACOH2B_06565, partial [Burkholderiaceae bacterium]